MKKISACPGWLNLSEDRRSFVFEPEKAEIVREIFQLSIGGLGSYAIANHLTRHNIPPFAPSTKWDHTTIDSMLRNRATVGEHQPRSYVGGSKKGTPIGNPISAYYPAVIDEATFQAAQEARRRNLLTGRGRKGNNIANLFTGLTTCSYCGSSVKFHSNGADKSLICEQVLNDAGCIRFAWSYRSFETAVLHFVAHPAFVERFTGDELTTMTNLAGLVRQFSRDGTYDARFQIATMLKNVVSELKVASAGSNPTPSMSGALVRRDNPKRFFEIKLWDGPSYVGMPIQ
jgi:hypothetical protein